MSTHTAKAQLRDVLAELYSDEGSALRVVVDSGMDEGRIQFSRQSINNWQAILTEAEKAGKVEAVLDTVIREYPNNVSLLTAAIEWQSVRLRALRAFPSVTSELEMPIEFDWIMIQDGKFLMGDG